MRKPKENAILSEIDGTVSFGQYSKGRRKVTITPEMGDSVDYFISKGKHVSVLEGDYVRAGEPLMDGSANPHDILRIRGVKELAKYLVDEVQEVYRLQGVSINDKHIEVIVKQMLRQVTVNGCWRFSISYWGRHVEKWRFEEDKSTNRGTGRETGHRRTPLIGDYQGLLEYREFYLGCILSGDDQGLI